MAIARQGSYLVVSRATPTLPNYCVKCGEPGAKTLRKTYQWHHPAYFLLIFVCLLLYAIVGSFVSAKMPLTVSLCRRHAGRRVILLSLGVVLLLGAIPLGIVLGGGAGIATGALGFLAGLVVLVIATNTIRPIAMTDKEATYTGFGEGFLARFSGK